MRGRLRSCIRVPALAVGFAPSGGTVQLAPPNDARLSSAAVYLAVAHAAARRESFGVEVVPLGSARMLRSERAALDDAAQAMPGLGLEWAVPVDPVGTRIVLAEGLAAR